MFRCEFEDEGMDDLGKYTPTKTIMSNSDNAPYNADLDPHWPAGKKFRKSILKGSRSSWGKFMDSRKPITDDLFHRPNVIGRLQVDPVLRRLTEGLTEDQGHFSIDGPFTFDDMGYSHGREANCASKFSLRDPQLIKNLFKKFPRMDRRQVVPRSHSFTSSMIINNSDIVSLSVFKPETDAPLVVNSDTPLTFADPMQGFQVIGRRHSKIFNNNCLIKLGHPLYGTFQNVRRKISRGKKKGKYKDIDLYYGFHSLRHFMASYLADREKVGTQAISKLLRHKSIRTTEIYLHSVDESQRSAMVSLEGKFTSKKPDAHTEGAHGKPKTV